MLDAPARLPLKDPDLCRQANLGGIRAECGAGGSRQGVRSKVLSPTYGGEGLGEGDVPDQAALPRFS